MILAECSMAMWLGHSCMGLTSKLVQHKGAVSQAETRRGMDKIEKTRRENNNSLVILPA
jgi:hypothetical protein